MRLAVKPGHDKQLIGDEYLLTVLKGQAGIGCHGNNDLHPAAQSFARRVSRKPTSQIPRRRSSCACAVSAAICVRSRVTSSEAGGCGVPDIAARQRSRPKVIKPTR